MKRILVAIDGSDGALRAVDYAAKLANIHGAELIIANVIGGGLPDNLFGRITNAQQTWLNELLASESAEVLSKARDHARSIGPAPVRLESRTGDIAQTIIEIAKDRQADTVVVGKRGTGRIGGLLLGSVSQKLVSLAPLPVTVVP